MTRNAKPRRGRCCGTSPSPSTDSWPGRTTGLDGLDGLDDRILGTFVSRDLRERPFHACYERWDATRQISASRRYTDDQRAAKHVLPFWADWAICDIRPSDTDDWIGLLSLRMGPSHCATAMP